MAGQSSPRSQPTAPPDPAGPWRDDLAFQPVAGPAAEPIRELVRTLATSLDVTYAFVAEFAGTPARVRTIALWGRGAWLDDIEYELRGTPCEEVAQGAVCHHVDGVAERFPEDRPLVEMGARGYLGVPLIGAGGDVLGHLAVIDAKPIPQGSPAVTMIQLFADRVRVELERLRADVVLDRASRVLEIRL